MKRLCLLYKIIKYKTTRCLFDLISHTCHFLNTRNQHLISQIFCRTISFSNSFLPHSIREWNNLNHDTTKIDCYPSFRNTLLKSMRPVPNRFFDACDLLDLKLLTRLRVGLSHLHEHKFIHGFNDVINPLCLCNTEVESVSHYYLRCPNYINQRSDLMNELSNLDPSILLLNHNTLTTLLLFGNNS